jgi:hypothetical protein
MGVQGECFLFAGYLLHGASSLSAAELGSAGPRETMLTDCFATLRIYAFCFGATLVIRYETVQYHNPEDNTNLQMLHRT